MSQVFGSNIIRQSEIFLSTSLSCAFVNLRPLVPGHVLVIPKERIHRLSSLPPANITDLFLTVQRVSKIVEKAFKATSMTIAIQDGKHAGQTVDHLHVHLIPRFENDFEDNDDVYRGIESPRKDRSLEEMEKEAEMLRCIVEDSQ